MGLAVTTVANGGLPVKDLGGPGGIAVTEVASYGLAVTKVTGARGGLGVSFVTANGAVVPGVTYATWDAATVTAVTLSGGNLVATNTGTTSADQGARVASAAGKASGKYYFEVTFTTVVGAVSSSANYGIGVGTFASTYTAMGGGGTTGTVMYKGTSVYSNGGQLITTMGGAYTSGQTACIAVDFDNRRIWFRQAPSGIWNNNAANNPATNVGGFAVPAGTMVPFLTFGGTNGTAGNVLTANFGASAFSGAVPSGFTAGWPT